MRDHDSYEDDWKEEAPTLAGLDKNTGLDVPEGYFEGLPASVLDRIRNLPVEEVPGGDSASVEESPREVERPDRKVIVFRQRRFWAVAAGIVLMAVVGGYLLMRPDGTPEVLTDVTIRNETRVLLAEMEPVEIAQDIDVTHVSDEQLFDALGNEGQAALDGMGQGVDQDEAIEYLKDVDLDAIDFQGLDIDLNDLR
jgi:hypothetical protein